MAIAVNCGSSVCKADQQSWIGQCREIRETLRANVELLGIIVGPSITDRNIPEPATSAEMLSQLLDDLSDMSRDALSGLERLAKRIG